MWVDVLYPRDRDLDDLRHAIEEIVPGLLEHVLARAVGQGIDAVCVRLLHGLVNRRIAQRCQVGQDCVAIPWRAPFATLAQEAGEAAVLPQDAEEREVADHCQRGLWWG